MKYKFVSTSVKGEPVSLAVEQRVIAAGLSRTAFLRNLEIPLIYA